MRNVVFSAVVWAGLLTAQTWKEFSLAPAGRLDKPLEKTVEWTFAETGSKVLYPACCPWLDMEGGFAKPGNDPWSLHANGISIKSLLARMEGLPQVQVVAPDWMTKDRYELTARVSDEVRLQLRRREDSAHNVRDELRKLVAAEVIERMQIKMHRESREVPVYVLKTRRGETPELGNGDGVSGLQAWAKDGAFQSVNANDFIVLTWLQNVVKRPVFGEGLPAGPYRFELKWRVGDQKSLESALGRMGLDLVEEKRSLEFLVVEYALKPEWR